MRILTHFLVATICSYGTLSAQNPVKTDTLKLTFKPGWNIFSTNVVPDSVDMQYLFQPLIDRGKLIKIQDEIGNALEDYDILGRWTNNIGNISLTKGYKIKVNDTCRLILTGKRVTLPFEIPLKTGWGIMAYPSIAMIDGKLAVKKIIDKNTMVKVQD